MLDVRKGAQYAPIVGFHPAFWGQMIGLNRQECYSTPE